MDKKEIKALQDVDYAVLTQEQQNKLREFEAKFNEEFGEDFNILIMDKIKENK
ncbi:hypothetical protein JK636_03550 [Clostridium sp. YIM B02515]|uniref:Uncharacterized protein n=1 Tax=Clostridium rhizosphaerae TaxID=2803861 RepID=A0ABS1T654_9CLOT|nr:hypothetical protein [Clostridium rhizosphaerae]MBL4934829.1 hypothetical protein [Clostridium rhizosphaerae]